ncbi:hypothetical protein ACHWQZ_G015087 [Mnemiopsis leidyi]
MKIRQGSPVERIINDPAPRPLITTSTPCRDTEDAACTIQAILRPKNAKRQTKHGTMVRPEDKDRNAAADLIESFPMVLFRSESGSDGRKCSQIAKEMLKDLKECTGSEELPQVFICQKFIGGYDELKIFDQQGLVEMQLRMYSRKIGEPHPAVQFSKEPEKKKKNPFEFKFVRLARENQAREAEKQKRKTKSSHVKLW